MEARSESGSNIPQEYSVSSLSRALKDTLEKSFSSVRVKGEIGRVTRAQSGHVYLDLKDEKAVLSCVIWRGERARIDFQPETGQEVLCTGRITTYGGQSRYQLVIESMAFAGAGALMLEMEKRRKKLFAEGLFDEARKKPLPYFPQVIGVVSSPSGAVIRDILHRIRARSGAHVLLWPVRVQGKEAAGEVAAAIKGFNALEAGRALPRPQLLIVARGGGALEDLWPFNDEALLRAAAKSDIPLISAIGHETDRMLLDEVADLRAPTPSAAAEIAVPVAADLRASLASLEARRLSAMEKAMRQDKERLMRLAKTLEGARDALQHAEQRLDDQSLRLPKALRHHLEKWRARAQSLGRARLQSAMRSRLARVQKFDEKRLQSALTFRLQSTRARLQSCVKMLESLSHRSVLKRGFVLVFSAKDKLLRHAEDAKRESALRLLFADASLSARPLSPSGGAAQKSGGKTPPQKTLFEK